MPQELRWETAGTAGRIFIVFGWVFMWGVVFPIGALALIVAVCSVGDAMMDQDRRSVSQHECRCE
jgi:hypothetical protein